MKWERGRRDPRAHRHQDRRHQALPAHAPSEPTTVVGTVVVDPDVLRTDPVVVFATPGGTYSRRYWDLQPPGRTGYSQAEWVVARGDVLIALDYLGGGDKQPSVRWRLHDAGGVR